MWSHMPAATRALGLLGTLRKQLAAADAQIELIDAWLAAEQQAGKPVVLILDQVEEVFTRRNQDQPHELKGFVAALQGLDAGAHKPQGVMLLGFRKEHLAEIVSALREHHIAFVGQFLAPLDAYAVEEVLRGPVRTERLRAKYGIVLDDELPAIVAHDLTADPESPVAPTLNILLRKLWSAATEKAASAPHFSAALYNQLRREGILLDDFLHQQGAKIAQDLPDDVASGLLLDLWAFHTTPIGTSDQRDVGELHQVYGHHPRLDALVLRSKELYVLTDPPGDNPNAGTQLAHDALAPLVRRDFDQSALPGQQARRLLENRAIDWKDGTDGTLLDDAALAVIDKGLAGMRNLLPDEQRLLTASQEARARQLMQKRVKQTMVAATVLIILALTALTYFLWQAQIVSDARVEAQQAKTEAEVAQAQALLAKTQTEFQLRQTQASEAQRLAQLAQLLLTKDPVVSLQVALAALPQSPDQPLVPEAEYALRQAAFSSRERKFITTTASSADQIAIRGNRVAVGGARPIVYDVELNPQEFPLPADFADIQGLRWGNDGRLLGWNATTAWVTGGGEPFSFSLNAQGLDVRDDTIQCAEWQPAQRWVAICTFNSLYAWQPESGRIITLTTEIDTPDLPTEPRSAVWSSDGRRLAGLGAKLALWDSQSPQTPAQVFYPPQEPGQPVSFAYWLPADESLVAGWFAPGAADLTLQLWQRDAEELQPLTLPGNFVEHIWQVEAVYAPDPDDGTPRLLLWANDGFMALYGIDGKQIAAATDILRNLNGVSLSPNGERVAGYSANGAAALWNLADLSMVVPLDMANGFTAGSLTYVDWLDGNTLALTDENGLVQVAQRGDMSSSLSVTPLYGYAASDRIARSLRLADGRLLTAGYSDDGASSLRIWQIDPVPSLTGQGLPAATEPLCRRMHRTVAIPPGVARPNILAWQPGDELLTTDGEGQVAHWTIGGEAQVLPADEDRRIVVVAPDAMRILRYGDGTDGQIWRLDASGWVQEDSLAGELSGAIWTDHGILATFADGSAAVIDPAGRRQTAPAGIALSGSILPAEGLLLAMRGDALELVRLGDEQPLAAWPIPDGRRLRLDDVAEGGELLVYRDRTFGQLYVLRLDAGAHTLDEVWRSEQAHVDSAPARLNPAMPLLASVNDGVVSLVDLEQGRSIWQSTSVGAVAGQSFRTVNWSTDGQYLITQAQPLQQSSFTRNIGVWHWSAEQRRPILLQEVPSSGLLGVSPDTGALLAGEPGQPFADRPYYYPVLANTTQLQTDVQASCLLARPLSDAQRESYMIAER